jgi:hypothetical protein
MDFGRDLSTILLICLSIAWIVCAIVLGRHNAGDSWAKNINRVTTIAMMVVCLILSVVSFIVLVTVDYQDKHFV